MPETHAEPILVVDDDEDSLSLSSRILRHDGFSSVSTLTSGAAMTHFLGTHPCSLVLLDLGLPDSDERLLERVVNGYPNTSVVVVSGRNEIDTAVRCVRRGAYDYVLKPFAPSRLVEATRGALGRGGRPTLAQLATRRSPTRAEAEQAFADLVTDDAQMRKIFEYLRVIAPTGQPVLISGATGTGKDLIARAVHRLSGRRGDFVAVNVAGYDDAMFSDGLFGHRKGAFTGATEPRPGMVLRASGGTLFLDEIGDLAIASQVKLLRLLQDGDYFPLGCDQPKVSTARIVAATSQDLAALQEHGAFRSDLFYRLNTHHVRIPSLRERAGDIPVLLDHFVAEAARHFNRRRVRASAQLNASLRSYHFPGNVRELRSLVFDSFARTSGETLDPGPFELAMRRADRADRAASPVTFADALPTLRQVQDLLVDEALRRTNGNQARAAAMLGVTRQAMNKRVRGKLAAPPPASDSGSSAAG
jgi:DNA-binding NtrC family response regulator